MASSQIIVTPDHLGIFHVKNISSESVDTVNKYLQSNHDEFHILWNVPRNLHNHQVHYLLTDLALGATPAQICQAFESNTAYQRPLQAGDESQEKVITDVTFESALGWADYYASWVRYFQGEISAKGWQAVLTENLFAGTPRANDLLGRMFEGAVHPIIHLGFGVEFVQPPIIAEALAQAAVHPVGGARFLLRAEELAKGNPAWTEQQLTSLFDEARLTPAIKDAECWKPGSYERDGAVFDVAPADLLGLAAKYKLDHEASEEQLQRRLAEMINVVTWFTSAAQRPDKQAKFDFFLMHAVNCSIFLSVFAAQAWLSRSAKLRLLEFTVRTDLVLYVTQGCPELRIDEIANYRPRRPECVTWEDVIERAKAIPCDGHVVKMVRALNHGQMVCQRYDATEQWPIHQNMWIKVANMVLDSTEDHASVLDKWMRGPGFDKAWDVVADKPIVRAS